MTVTQCRKNPRAGTGSDPLFKLQTMLVVLSQETGGSPGSARGLCNVKELCTVLGEEAV